MVKFYKIKYNSPKEGGYKANIVVGYFIENGKNKKLTFWREGSEYGSEYYTGPNYVEPFDSKNKSYSRNYVSLKGLPKKYANAVKKLITLYRKHYNDI